MLRIVMRSNVRRLVMDQVTKVRQHFKREEGKSIISECRASGMTVKAWCQTHGIVEQTYYKNLKQLREEMIENLPAPIDTNICEKPTVFKKLEVQATLPDTKAAVIIRFGSATVEVNEGTYQQTIQAVLLALHNIC